MCSSVLVLLHSSAQRSPASREHLDCCPGPSLILHLPIRYGLRMREKEFLIRKVRYPQRSAILRPPAGVRTRSQTKNGPPSTDVITPTGISAGAMAVRAKVSQIIRKRPPNKHVAGSNRRCPPPTSRRQICGAMSPIKPMGPQTATIPPTHIDVAIKRMPLVRRTSTPRLIASSSPTVIKLSSCVTAYRTKMLMPTSGINWKTRS